MFLADDGSNAKRKYVHGTKLKDCTFQVGGLGGWLRFTFLILVCSVVTGWIQLFFLKLLLFLRFLKVTKNKVAKQNESTHSAGCSGVWGHAETKGEQTRGQERWEASHRTALQQKGKQTFQHNHKYVILRRESNQRVCCSQQYPHPEQPLSNIVSAAWPKASGDSCGKHVLWKFIKVPLFSISPGSHFRGVDKYSRLNATSVPRGCLVVSFFPLLPPTVL